MLITSVARDGLMREDLLVPQALGGVPVGPVENQLRRLEDHAPRTTRHSRILNRVISVVVPARTHRRQFRAGGYLFLQN
jgi:hypothetical protein